MKKSAKSELRAKGAGDLQTQAKELREQLMKARFSQRMEGKSKGMRYRASRRQIARIETILREKAASAAQKG